MSNLQWQIGDVRITRIVETEAPLPLVGLLPQATAQALAPHADWLQPHFVDAEGNCVLSIHSLAIESQGRRILVDTCVGDQPVPGFDGLGGGPSSFLDDLAAAGFPRESIDTVLCTHLHFDHVGWNTMCEGDRRVPTFPNARYLFARKEWEHWRAEEQLTFAPNLPETVQPILDAGLADLVDSDHRLTDEVQLEATPGHTPGHVAVRIASGGETAMITGDLTHHPVQWGEPGWGMDADSDGAQAEATRRRLLAEHANTPLLVIGTHYPAPCAGHLRRQGSAHRFEALGSES